MPTVSALMVNQEQLHVVVYTIALNLLTAQAQSGGKLPLQT